MTLANDLVQFLMNIFGDRQAAQAFLDNPERALEDHGLGAVCSADVDAALPVVLDFAPVTVNASRFDREYNTGGNTARTDNNGGGGNVTPPPGGHGGGHHDDHAHAVQQLHHIVNNYSYTSTVDDRDTITDQSVNQNIWADGDVEQWFDNDAVVASGDRAIAAGDDADVEDSNNIEDSYNTDNSSDESTDNSIRAGEDVNIGNTDIDADESFNTDLDVDVDDSFNDKSVEIDDSFNRDESINTDVDVDVKLEDSFNAEETNNDVAVTDSFNKETTELEVELEDSFNDTTTNVNVAESFNPVVDSFTVDDSFTQETNTDVAIDDVNTAVAGDAATAGDDAAAVG
jgi:hypothetical protein